jgi:murein DD-endopeptidase MepM/ murein hydrolase activator NlpD
MKKYLSDSFIKSVLLLSLFAALFTAFQSEPGEKVLITDLPGGGEYSFEKSECITDEQRHEIQAHINDNIAMLKKQGRISDDPEAIVQFSWPLRGANNLEDYNYWGISNYVDQNGSTGLLDYNCGARTYNGHKGTDIYSWPFGWYKMDNSQVEIIAGAPGVIIYKSEGQSDRSCAMNNNQWNAIYVRHADNSVAWYGHMKKNSVTTKNVGDNVVLGEYLGVMGSSGNSTGPHLHFEVYNASNVLVDPWQGTCNSLNAQTWWQAQKPYFDPKINALMTHSRPPVFPACPQQEIINEKKNFNPGDSILTVAYYSDQPSGAPTQFTVTMPDNTIWKNWSFSSNTYYSSSYWYWTHILPNNAQSGTWKFKAVFNSLTYEKTFNVAPTGITPIEGEIPASYSIGQNYPNPFNPVTNIKFSIPKTGEVILKVYDISGKEVTELINRSLNAGTYNYDFDASHLSSGIYFYTLVSGDFTGTKRMVLVK